MTEISYTGELLWPSAAGHFLVITAFVAALSAAIAYLWASRTASKQWLAMGRGMFAIHGLSVFLVIALLLGLMISRRYEYAYVWEHVSDQLPLRFILSALWEGQEGSFLLWIFWHVCFGLVLIFTSGKWESRTMWVLMLVQAFITSMILGIYFGSVRLGVDPFALLRDTMDAPIFQRPDYVNLIEGNGLNPLLQNYWMIIHPPTLFLGFASVTIPFCFALGSLERRDFAGWIQPVLPWALFSSAFLGTGILMGGAWAYEALSFGGYWAWDPVENMSLVPWIVLVAAIHANLVSRATGHSTRLAYSMYILSFVLVLYSTFLTRSGILGDSSAHAFTQMGLEWQLVGFIAVFAFSSLFLLITRWKSIPSPEREEKTASREFWMFVGTLVLLFSAVLISFTTSIPVYNAIIDSLASATGIDAAEWKRSSPVDPVAHYNKFQIWIAVMVGLLSALAQILRYRAIGWADHKTAFARETVVCAAAAALLTIFMGWWINTAGWQYVVLLYAMSFAIICNGLHLWRTVRQSPRFAGSALGHLGFAIMIVGTMASGLNKSILSSSSAPQDTIMEGMDPARFVTLIKNRPQLMNGYQVEYLDDDYDGNMREFVISFNKVTPEGDTAESFLIRPNVLFNRTLTKVEATNPSTRHFVDRDIFTYVAALPGEQMDIEQARRINDTLNFVSYEVHLGDTISFDRYQLVATGITGQPDNAAYERMAGDLPLQVNFEILYRASGIGLKDSCLVYMREGVIYGLPAQINDLKIRVRIPDRAYYQFYVNDVSLEYSEFQLKRGESFSKGNARITLRDIERSPSHPQYIRVEGDVGINAILDVESPSDTMVARPMYLIRNNQALNFKAFLPEAGLHLRFTRIDPATETFYFMAALDDSDRTMSYLEIAENVPRTDIIVIESIVFPGINLFWGGSILMLTGFLVAFQAKRRKIKGQ